MVDRVAVQEAGGAEVVAAIGQAEQAGFRVCLLAQLAASRVMGSPRCAMRASPLPFLARSQGIKEPPLYAFGPACIRNYFGGPRLIRFVDCGDHLIRRPIRSKVKRGAESFLPPLSRIKQKRIGG